MAKQLRIKPSLLTDVKTLLSATRDYIKKHPAAWTRDAFGRDKNDNSCSAVSPEAKRFCALGYAIHTAGDLFGIESHRVKSSTDELWDPDSAPIGTLVYGLNREAQAIYNQAVKVLDFAVQCNNLEGDPGDIVTYNDEFADRPRDIVRVFDYAVGLLSEV